MTRRTIVTGFNKRTQTVWMNATNTVCPIRETTGKNNIKQAKIQVLSCEGACIRGEFARLAADYVSRNEKYVRSQRQAGAGLIAMLRRSQGG